MVVQNSDPDYPLQTPPGRSGRAEKAKQAYGIDAVNEFDPFFEEVYDHCDAMGLDIDTLTHEGGAGQMEINFNHGDALSLADQKPFYSNALCGKQRWIMAFTPPSGKSRCNISQARQCICMYQFLIKKQAKISLQDQMAKEAEPFFNAMGGLQSYLPGGMALMAPFVNSYRRLSLTYDAPRNVAWGYDNRTVGLRVPMGYFKK